MVQSFAKVAPVEDKMARFYPWNRTTRTHNAHLPTRMHTHPRHKTHTTPTQDTHLPTSTHGTYVKLGARITQGEGPTHPSGTATFPTVSLSVSLSLSGAAARPDPYERQRKNTVSGGGREGPKKGPTRSVRNGWAKRYVTENQRKRPTRSVRNGWAKR